MGSSVTVLAQNNAKSLQIVKAFFLGSEIYGQSALDKIETLIAKDQEEIFS